MLLSLAIIAVAAVVLVHMLRDINVDEVMAALKAIERRHIIAAAAVFVAGGYFTLTFYDWFALRTIGRTEIPYRIAALSGFTSYSIGHNIGATVFTGGAVRYRIYSAYGLDAIEVAKICFVAGLTFWLGNATVLGLGIFHSPHAAGWLDQLPVWLNRCIAVAMLAGARLLSRLGLERAARDRAGRVESAAAERPVDSAADRHRHSRSRLLRARHVHAAAGRAEYRLRDAGWWCSYRRRMLGFASHAPGGLGVFDAAMLVALVAIRQGRPVLAGLLLFRVLYYLAPFVVALMILGTREI